MEEKHKYGLIGKDISYSFSRGYFTEKFKHLKKENHTYLNFDLQTIQEFKILRAKDDDIKGFNVTIPYKEKIIPYLDELDVKAKEIGAVNTIQVIEGRLIGHNTDVYGFRNSIEPYIQKHHKKALILGTGGASKAVAFVFKELGIAYSFVSRNPKKDQLVYKDLNKTILDKHHIIVNCTPLGTHPNIKQKAPLPYQYLSNKHLLFDLIYNPEKTAFLLEGEKNGASICNGHRMLELQAEKSWEIWNTD